MESMKVLGVRVDLIQIPDLLEKMEQWISEDSGTHYISFTNQNSIMQCQKDNYFKRVINCADISAPDSTPLVWTARSRGNYLKDRVTAPATFPAFLKIAAKKGYRNFFYGGAEGVPELLAEKMVKKYPGLKVVGTYSPPFRPLTDEEDLEVINMINKASPDVLWVALGCPKQERWMYEHKDKLDVPVMAGIGFAFDVYTGRKNKAPEWIAKMGLEWLLRLIQDPKRLWRRYLIDGTSFVYKVIQENRHVKKANQ